MPEELTPALGAVKSPPDYRDIPLAAAGVVALPDTFKTDVSPFPVWNQRKIGSCVAHAFAKAMQIWWFKKTGEVVNFSARFLFALAKSQDGLPGDVGTYPRLVASIAKNVGCCTEALLPNDSSLSFADYIDITKITQEMKDEAAKYKIPGYVFAHTAYEIRQAIYQYGAVALLMQIGKEWWTRPDGVSSWNDADIDPLRVPALVASGHEIVGFGWEDTFDDILNSWSAAWAKNGTNKFDINAWAQWVGEAIAIADIPQPVLDIVHQLPTPQNFRHVFNTVLLPGDRNQEIIYLQAALMLDGDFDANEYAQLLQEGNLGYFKPNGDTQAALTKFQKKYGIPPYPRVGPLTQAQLNKLFNA
jgi:hypothetical protein